MTIALLIWQKSVEFKAKKCYQTMRVQIMILFIFEMYRKLQNRQLKSLGPLSWTALRWPTNVVCRLNDFPHISHVNVLPCLRTCVLKWSLMLNSFSQIGHLQTNSCENLKFVIKNRKPRELLIANVRTLNFLDFYANLCARQWQLMIRSCKAKRWMDARWMIPLIW